MTPTRFALEVNPALPQPLARLAELASNLRFSWHRPTRALFDSLDHALWKRVRGNPRLFLRCVEQSMLEQAADDPSFLENYRKVVSGFDQYLHEESVVVHDGNAPPDELVAYFCAEYGFHESFQIYSGGLGVLAGDHCKTASDLGLDFVAVGLLYTQGYFTQTIDKDGNQIAQYREHEQADLPVEPALDRDGRPVSIVVRIAGRDVHARVWQAHAGRVCVYLLDTNVERNAPADREITHKLYGGDENVRIRQEIVLGIGGVKALRAVGRSPGIWHINEGHAAFLVLELTRELVEQGADFASAWEAAAARCAFTTHTPVAAGHDVFSRELVLGTLGELAGQLGIDAERFLALGRPPVGGHHFNMTRLAINGSRHQNGVSRIHGRVSSRLLTESWPEVPPEDNPVGYITNGVHVPTFLYQAWADFFDMSLGGNWRSHLTDTAFWKRIQDVPDQLFWNVRQAVKSQVLGSLRERLHQQCQRNCVSEAHFERLTRLIDPARPDVLTIGFARRFATYKRATLLLNDLARLASIVGMPERPVVFVFAGKSHPADEPGRKLLRDLNSIGAGPEFLGKIVFLEDYDMGLARQLVAGVDVWLNNPVSPLEASGTSGIKAAINGTINLSVLDGWWSEGFDGTNGWAIASASSDNEGDRDRDDAQTLYELLEDHVIPLYYQRNELGISPGWIAMSKRSMATIVPGFNMRRVLENYVTGVYRPSARSGRKLASERLGGARHLAAWKEKTRRAWPGVTVRHLESTPPRMAYGGPMKVRVAAFLNGLAPEDVHVELVMDRTLPESSNEPPRFTSFPNSHGSAEREGRLSELFQPIGATDGEGMHTFTLEFTPPWCGQLAYAIRIVPYHELLSHPYEMGLMKWV
jgi:starch phosphorylase